jgi:transposase
MQVAAILKEVYGISIVFLAFWSGVIWNRLGNLKSETIPNLQKEIDANSEFCNECKNNRNVTEEAIKEELSGIRESLAEIRSDVKNLRGEFKRELLVRAH